MYKTIFGLSVSIALSGCAGGRFVSTGSVNYVKLFDALSCEVQKVFANYPTSDSAGGSQLVIPENWQAKVDVTIDGGIDRNIGVDASLAEYGIGGSDILGGVASVRHSIEDIGKITLSRTIYRDGETGQPASYKDFCIKASGIPYDVSKLGLEDWFKAIERNSVGVGSDELMGQLEYTRTALLKLGPNQLSLSLLPTVKIAPKFGFSVGETLEIAVVFEGVTKRSNATVKIDDESLAQLAKLIRGGSIVLKRTAPVQPARDSGSTLEDREMRRNLEKLNENTDFLRRQLLLQ